MIKDNYINYSDLADRVRSIYTLGTPIRCFNEHRINVDSDSTHFPMFTLNRFIGHNVNFRSIRDAYYNLLRQDYLSNHVRFRESIETDAEELERENIIKSYINNILFENRRIFYISNRPDPSIHEHPIYEDSFKILNSYGLKSKDDDISFGKTIINNIHKFIITPNLLFDDIIHRGINGSEQMILTSMEGSLPGKVLGTTRVADPDYSYGRDLKYLIDYYSLARYEEVSRAGTSPVRRSVSLDVTWLYTMTFNKEYLPYISLLIWMNKPIPSELLEFWVDEDFIKTGKDNIDKNVRMYYVRHLRKRLKENNIKIVVKKNLSSLLLEKEVPMTFKNNREKKKFEMDLILNSCNEILEEISTEDSPNEQHYYDV